MIADAINTAWTLGWALLAWIVLMAVVAGVVLYAVVVTVAWPCRAAGEAVAGALAAWRAVRALAERPERYAPRQVPLWAAA